MSARIELQRLHEMVMLSRSHVQERVDAARVMLDKFHQPPLDIDVDWSSRQSIGLDWLPLDDRTRMTHANELDAIEEGACAISFVVASRGGYVVRRRAHQGSGADYLITRTGEPENDYVRLEVRGVARIRLDDRRHLERCCKEKVEQLRKGNLDRPGIAMVVGFQHARVVVAEAS